MGRANLVWRADTPPRLVAKLHNGPTLMGGRERFRALPSLTDLDVAILRACFSGDASFYAKDLASTSALAARVGAHRNTVGPRMRALAKARVLLPWRLDADAAAMGLARARVVFSGPSPFRDEAALRSILKVDGVKAVNEYGPEWGVVVHAEDDARLQARIELAGEIGGAGAKHVCYQIGAPPPKRWPRLSPRELRVLAAIVGEEDADAARLAADLKVSERTIRRDLDRLTRARILVLHYGGEATPPRQALAYVEARGDPAALARLEAALPGVVMRNALPDALHLFLVGPSHEAISKRVAEASRGAATLVRPWTRRHLNPAYFAWHKAMLERRADLIESIR